MNTVTEQHRARLKAIDRLLPDPPPLSASEGALLSASAGGGMAEGLASVTSVRPDQPVALGRTLVEHRLDIRLAGEHPEQAFDALLYQWNEHLAATTARGDWESSAVVLRPSRDATGSTALLRHGFAPLRVIAARPAQRQPGGPSATPGVRIRPAGREDLDSAVRLHLELRRYDADFGVVTPRADDERLIAAEVESLLGREEPTVWIAELYGRPLGMVQFQLPPDSSWMLPYVAADRPGYLSSLNVSEAARSNGVGTALAAHAHHVFDEEGVEVALLHHALANPRSTPFWYGQGYRPLWTYWCRRPAID